MTKVRDLIEFQGEFQKLSATQLGVIVFNLNSLHLFPGSGNFNFLN